MMVFSVCVNDAVLLLYMLLFKSCFGSSCDSHHLLLLVVIIVFQNQKELYCQVCLHIRGICFHDRSFTVQQNDNDRTKNTDKKIK